jgi:NADH-quinone oxidoreductase subunit F
MIIYAIAAGKRAAIAIDKYLYHDASRVILNDKKTKAVSGATEDDKARWEVQQRLIVPTLATEKRARNFEEIELPFSEEEAKREAKRCLRCDLEVGE